MPERRFSKPDQPLDAPVTSMILLITDFPLIWAPIRKRGRSCVWVQMIPPLARSVWPLIQAPSGPARKATVAAMSAGWPRRSNGASLAKRSTTSCGLPCRKRSVAVGPGATALTVMLRPAQFLGQDAGHRLDCGFGAGIDAISRLQQADDAGREVDDASALAQTLGRLAQRVECALEVDFD